jgi:hypothetical protein
MSLGDESSIARTVASEPGGVGRQRGEPLHPPVDRHVVDFDPALGEQLFDIAVAEPRNAGTTEPPPRSLQLESEMR